jgi:hypothetical protein
MRRHATLGVGGGGGGGILGWLGIASLDGLTIAVAAIPLVVGTLSVQVIM